MRSKQEELDRLVPKTEAERDELISLGMVLKHAMHRVNDAAKFTPAEMREGITFKTHFNLSGGSEWGVEVVRRK